MIFFILLSLHEKQMEVGNLRSCPMAYSEQRSRLEVKCSGLAVTLVLHSSPGDLHSGQLFSVSSPMT